MVLLKSNMEKFCLKFNDFQPNVTKSFQRLRHEEEYSDVTLIGDDYQPLKAHKVILSSCSEYFKNVLYNSKNHSNPVLCMEGLIESDLKNVLDFIYNGELKLYPDDLEQFLRISQRLKIDGLSWQDGNEKVEVKPFIGNTETEDLDPISTVDPVTELTEASDINCSNATTEKQENIKRVFLQPDELNAQEIDKKLDEMFSVDTSGMYNCNYCSRVSNKKSNMREHAEVHVDGLIFSCNFCDKSYRSHSALRTHNRRHHASK